MSSFREAIEAKFIAGMDPMTSLYRNAMAKQFEVDDFELGKAKRLEAKELSKDIAEMQQNSGDPAVIEMFKDMLRGLTAKR
jgi:TPP-dependent pyruvate/acetoin dehydrogenase alpha subunit